MGIDTVQEENSKKWNYFQIKDNAPIKQENNGIQKEHQRIRVLGN